MGFMKKQLKQSIATITTPHHSGDNSENVMVRENEMVNVENQKIPNRRNRPKRQHKRSFYMAINPKGGAVVTEKALPIFWRKKLAKGVAEKINGKAVKVTLSW